MSMRLIESEMSEITARLSDPLLLLRWQVLAPLAPAQPRYAGATEGHQGQQKGPPLPWTWTCPTTGCICVKQQVWPQMEWQEMPPSHSCKLVSITNDNVGQVSILLQCNIQQFACLRNYSYNDEEKTPHLMLIWILFLQKNNTSCCGELCDWDQAG